MYWWINLVTHTDLPVLVTTGVFTNAVCSAWNVFLVPQLPFVKIMFLLLHISSVSQGNFFFSSRSLRFMSNVRLQNTTEFSLIVHIMIVFYFCLFSTLLFPHWDPNPLKIVPWLSFTYHYIPITFGLEVGKC